MNLPTRLPANDRLVDGPRLLELLFDSDNRPCLRWLSYQRTRRAIPYFKIGKLVRYDPSLVRRALDERFQVCSR